MKRVVQAGCLILIAGILYFYSETSEYTVSAAVTAEAVEDTIAEVDTRVAVPLREEQVASTQAMAFLTSEPMEPVGNEEREETEDAKDTEETEDRNIVTESAPVPESELAGENTVHEEMPEANEEILGEIGAAVAAAGLESEYADFAISNVDGYVNIRDIPSTEGKKLGKLYHGAVAQILETVGEDKDWFHILSGSVEGYIKAEYFLYGDAAVEVIDQYVTRYAVSRVTKLNVRKEASTSSGKIGYLSLEEKAPILEDLGEWLKIEYSEGKSGYVYAAYVQREEQFTYAISLEEERENARRLAELKKREEEEKALREQATEATEEQNETPEYIASVVILQDGLDVGSQVLELAKQYLGNKYVHGGSTLSGGTDCSGFTSLLYKEFGYSLSRTPGGQLSSDGTLVSIDEIRVGDIVCYGKKGGRCTHVAIYAGDSQIIHSSTPKGGVKYSDLYYDNILGIKRIG